MTPLAPTVTLESPLPASLPPDVGTAIFCAGVCFDREQGTELSVIVDGVRHRPAAQRMPRPDVFRADGHPRSYRSGWWATLPIPLRAHGDAVRLQAAVRVRGRAEALVELGTIEVRDPAHPSARDPTRHPARPPVGAETIAVCMTTYEPDPALLESQLASLRAQTDERWACVISDDCSSDLHYERIATLVAGDERFTLTRAERRLGFYRNFERALTLIPDSAALVALCDQDDVWHPDKLATLRRSLGAAGMVYSDQRLVGADGAVLRDTMWRGRRNNHTNLASLLIANTITGAACLMRREVAERSLPFPETPGLQFHDHWLALVALASGPIAYVGRPLYDYVQHPGAVFGDVTHGPGSRRRSRGWRAAYFCGFLAREVQAQALLVRCSETLTPSQRRTLERFSAAARSPAAFTWLILRVLRAFAGHNETLGSELDLAPGIMWRWLIGAAARFSELTGRRSADATYPNPLDFEQRRIRRWRAGV